MTGGTILGDVFQTPRVTKNHEISMQVCLLCLETQIYYLPLYFTHIWKHSFASESNFVFQINIEKTQ